jgi:processive 1,2-diacylglycerol beta-glucosyltransferase
MAPADAADTGSARGHLLFCPLRASRVLILSASIGEGHDLPARVLAEGLVAEASETEVELVDTLALVGQPLRRIVINGSRFHSRLGNRLFDLTHRLISDVAPTRELAGRALEMLSSRPLQRVIATVGADIVVSTYPGATEVLGRLRARGRLGVPVVAVITDLAALRYWAHPGADLHLITHPESADEVRKIAPTTEIICVRGLTNQRFYESHSQADARRDLGLRADGPIVLVSGGGWGVGDLRGAIEEVVGLPGATVICLCGRNEQLRTDLAGRFAADPRVTVHGFSEQMPELLAAADVLVHSTAGLTVLEAIMRGCGVVSYGWGMGHVRANNEAFVRYNLAEVARSRQELGNALRRTLKAKPVADGSFASLPSAASAVLDCAQRVGATTGSG